MRLLAVLAAAACSDSKPAAPAPTVAVVDRPAVAPADAAPAVDAPPELDFDALDKRAAAYHEPPAALLVPYRDKDKWGYADRTGNIVIAPQFDGVNMFSSGRAVVAIGDDCGIIDAAGYRVVEIAYRSCTVGNDGYLAVAAYGKRLALDRTGKPLVHDTFDYVTAYVSSDGMVGVVRGNRGGFLHAGKLQIDFRFADHNDPREGRIPVAEDRKWGVVDYDGKLVVPFEYDVVHPFYRGLALAQKDGKWGAIDRDGKTVVPFDYEYIVGNAEPDYLVASKHFHEAPTTILDRTGKVVGTLRWPALEEYRDGLIPIEANGKTGYADITGRLVIPARWDHANGFHEGLAWAANNRRGGFIDKTGNYVIAARYGALYDYNFMIDGITDVRAGMIGKDDPPEDDLRLFIDRTGREYLSPDTRAWFAKTKKH